MIFLLHRELEKCLKSNLLSSVCICGVFLGGGRFTLCTLHSSWTLLPGFFTAVCISHFFLAATGPAGVNVSADPSLKPWSAFRSCEPGLQAGSSLCFVTLTLLNKLYSFELSGQRCFFEFYDKYWQHFSSAFRREDLNWWALNRMVPVSKLTGKGLLPGCGSVVEPEPIYCWACFPAVQWASVAGIPILESGFQLDRVSFQGEPSLLLNLPPPQSCACCRDYLLSMAPQFTQLIYHFGGDFWSLSSLLKKKKKLLAQPGTTQRWAVHTPPLDHKFSFWHDSQPQMGLEGPKFFPLAQLFDFLHLQSSIFPP